MPNIKSAKKRVKVIEKKTLRNNMIKSGYRSAVRKFEEAIEAGNVEEAKTLFVEATKKIDQACTKGVIVKNTAARKKSKLANKLNAKLKSVQDLLPQTGSEHKHTLGLIGTLLSGLGWISLLGVEKRKKKDE